MTVSDGVSPSPKVGGGAEPAWPPSKSATGIKSRADGVAQWLASPLTKYHHHYTVPQKTSPFLYFE